MRNEACLSLSCWPVCNLICHYRVGLFLILPIVIVLACLQFYLLFRLACFFILPIVTAFGLFVIFPIVIAFALFVTLPVIIAFGLFVV